MGKVKIDIFLSQWGYLEFIFAEMFFSIPLRFIWLLSKSQNLIGCQGDIMVILEKKNPED